MRPLGGLLRLSHGTAGGGRNTQPALVKELLKPSVAERVGFAAVAAIIVYDVGQPVSGERAMHLLFVGFVGTEPRDILIYAAHSIPVKHLLSSAHTPVRVLVAAVAVLYYPGIPAVREPSDNVV
ncbi:MAG: hypothetical protein IT464_08420 [Planctomycetes bacterium]|nr:hypothetical protein [Planctomycetota bacterium]